MAVERAPVRSVGLIAPMLFTLNGMIGAGIFAMPAILVGSVGAFAPFVVIAVGLAQYPPAFILSRLSQRFDSNGGPVLYAEAAFGKFIAFLVGLGAFIAQMAALAANALIMVTYLAALFPLLARPALHLTATLAILIAATAMALTGMKRSVEALGVMTFVKLTPLIALAIGGLLFGSPHVSISPPVAGDYRSAVLVTFYAYTGLVYAVLSAGEVKQSKRNVPIALISALICVTLFYALLVTAFAAIMPEGGGENALAAAAAMLAGPAGAITIVIAAGFSIWANLLNGIISMPRLIYGMAEQQTLPRWFGHLSRRTLVPDNAIILLGGLSCIMALWGNFASLAAVNVVANILVGCIMVFVLPVLRWRDPGRDGRRVDPVEILMSLIAGAVLIGLTWLAGGTPFAQILPMLIGGTVLYALARFAVIRSERRATVQPA